MDMFLCKPHLAPEGGRSPDAWACQDRGAAVAWNAEPRWLMLTVLPRKLVVLRQVVLLQLARRVAQIVVGVVGRASVSSWPPRWLLLALT